MNQDSFHFSPSDKESFSLGDYRLTEAEAAHVDGWLGQEAPAGHGAPPEARNAPTARLAEIIELLAKSGEPTAPPGLAVRTMAAVRRCSSPDSFAVKSMIAPQAPKVRIGWDRRRIDLAAMTVAAGLLFVVLISGIKQARFVAQRTACAGNLRALAGAFSSYAADDANMLPSIAPPADGNWLPVADTPGQRRSANAHSNLANLRPLVARGQFASWKRLICPSCQVKRAMRLGGNPAKGLPTDDISYSYIDELGPYHHHWNGSGRVAVMADYNPLFQGKTRAVNENSNSFNHDLRGENILSDNGAVRWVTTPDVGPRHDNIWTVQGDATPPFTGREEPQSRSDILLVP